VEQIIIMQAVVVVQFIQQAQYLVDMAAVVQVVNM
jgi:hypothetical protein